MQKARGVNERRTISILRSVTLIVKIFPFGYAVIYIFGMFGYLLFDEDICTWLDTFFFMSVLNVVLLVRLSYSVKLCIWHRIQCCLPLLPQPVIFIDNHIYCFGETLAIVNVWLAILIFTLSLVNAYNVFIKPAARR